MQLWHNAVAKFWLPTLAPTYAGGRNFPPDKPQKRTNVEPAPASASAVLWVKAAGMES